MPSSVIYWLNNTGIAEGHPSLLTFYDSKGHPVGDDDTNTSWVDEDPDITRVDKDTGEDPQDKYDATYVDIRNYGQQDDQEDP